MSRNVVHSGQSFLNKVVECTGDIDNAFQMMLLNNKTSLTSNEVVGEVLKASDVTDYDVYDFFQDRKPSTLKNKIVIINSSLDYLFPGEFPFSF
jgi:hypothetical protein